MDTKRYSYMAARITGSCLAGRADGPVYDGDTILFRSIEQECFSLLGTLLGGLVAVAIRTSSTRSAFMVKELYDVNVNTR